MKTLSKTLCAVLVSCGFAGSAVAATDTAPTTASTNSQNRNAQHARTNPCESEAARRSHQGWIHQHHHHAFILPGPGQGFAGQSDDDGHQSRFRDRSDGTISTGGLGRHEGSSEQSDSRPDRPIQQFDTLAETSAQAIVEAASRRAGHTPGADSRCAPPNLVSSNGTCRGSKSFYEGWAEDFGDETDERYRQDPACSPPRLWIRRNGACRHGFGSDHSGFPTRRPYEPKAAR